MNFQIEAILKCHPSHYGKVFYVGKKAKNRVYGKDFHFNDIIEYALNKRLTFKHTSRVKSGKNINKLVPGQNKKGDMLISTFISDVFNVNTKDKIDVANFVKNNLLELGISKSIVDRDYQNYIKSIEV